MNKLAAVVADLAAERLQNYSPVSFFRDRGLVLGELQRTQLLGALEKGDCLAMGRDQVLVSNLPWDSEHFGFPVYRLELLVGSQLSFVNAIKTALGDLQSRHPVFYASFEVPSEDLATLAACSQAGLRLVETRLTYQCQNLKNLTFSRHETRLATEADIPGLRKVAAETPNQYDRVHADPFFKSSEASRYLATYAENSVRGFADWVLVPSLPELPEYGPGAFLSANNDHWQGQALKLRLARMVLSAVAANRSGWYLRLVSELSARWRDEGIEAFYLTTQSSNRAVIRVWEKLGFRFGRCSHVFAASSGR